MSRKVTGMPTPKRATELECQEAIVAAAMLAGWLVHAERAALARSGRYSTPVQGDAGFPDLVLVHPARRRLLFVELKRRPNKVEPDQQRWHDALADAAVEISVCWVPEQMSDLLQLLTNPDEAP